MIDLKILARISLAKDHRKRIVELLSLLMAIESHRGSVLDQWRESSLKHPLNTLIFYLILRVASIMIPSELLVYCV
jgi:hypothetical protein